MQVARDRVGAAGDEQHATIMRRIVALEESMENCLSSAVSESNRFGAETRFNDGRDQQTDRESKRGIAEREREWELKSAREREKELQQYSYERRQTSSAKSEGQRLAARGERRSERHGSSSREGRQSSDHGSVGEASRCRSNSPRKSWSSGVSWSKRGTGESMKERERGIQEAGNGGGVMWTPRRHGQTRETLGWTRESSGRWFRVL